MWSHVFIYYNIQSDEKFSVSLPTDSVVKAIMDTGCFLQNDRQSFKGINDVEGVTLVVEKTTSGEYAASNKKLKLVNMIAVVGSKNADQKPYVRTFLRIAQAINWKLCLESDDDGNENIEIKTP